MLARLPVRNILSSTLPLPLSRSVGLIAIQHRTISSTPRVRAEVTVVQPQDLVVQAEQRRLALQRGEEVDPQLDGYPQLPYVSLQRRVAKGWWDNQERRNFGETLHEEEDALSMWSPDAHTMPAGKALTQMILAFSAIAAFGYGIYLTKAERPVAKRSYPFDGLSAELGGNALTPKAIPESAEEEE